MPEKSSSLANYKNLAHEIVREYDQITGLFSGFQRSTGLLCPAGCGKCCFKPDVYCTPFELLPLALELIERGEAIEVYEECKTYRGETCIFLSVDDKVKGLGKCREYNFRPLVCRAFGVAARHDKNGSIDFSVCSKLKEIHLEKYGELTRELQKHSFQNDEVPFIESAKGKLAGLDPRLMEKEYPIPEALFIILGKVLMAANFSD